MDNFTGPVTGNPKIDGILAIFGALVPLLSAITSFINHKVRQKTEAGLLPDNRLLAMGSALNFASINVDKGLQFAKLMAAASAAAKAEADRSADSADPQPPTAA